MVKYKCKHFSQIGGPKNHVSDQYLLYDETREEMFLWLESQKNITVISIIEACKRITVYYKEVLKDE